MYVAWGNPDGGSGSGSGASGFDCTGAGYFQFASNTVNVATHWIIKHSPYTGNRYCAEGIMVLRGELTACDGKTIDDWIDEMTDAFSYDGRTLALYKDDGTVTQHRLPNDVASLVDGPKVTRYSYPRGDRGEYTTHRTFFIEVRALYDYSDICDSTSGIIEYRESIRYLGLGGQQWAGAYDQSNVFRPWYGSTLTPIRLIQSGFSRGWGGYVTPLAAVEPTYLHSDQCVEEMTGPTSGKAEPSGTPGLPVHVSKEYTMRWVYPMTIPTYAAHAPLTKV